MYTEKTKSILRDVTLGNVLLDIAVAGIENVHLRGAMFGFYKAGSNVIKTPDGKWPAKGLQLIKPSKLINNFYGNGHWPDTTIETITNGIKSYVAMYGDEHGDGIESPIFSIARGGFIGYYYHEQNYSSTNGNLGGSCMRKDGFTDAFRLYENNPKHIGLLVMRNKDMKIVARALLWFVGKHTYMDTIYHAEDHFRDAMIKYANEHNFFYKTLQSCHYHVFDMFNGNRVDPRIIRVPVSVREEDPMPYIDSMLFMVSDNNGNYYLSNGIIAGDHKRKVRVIRYIDKPYLANTSAFGVSQFANAAPVMEAVFYLYNRVNKIPKRIDDFIAKNSTIKKHSLTSSYILDNAGIWGEDGANFSQSSCEAAKLLKAERKSVEVLSRIFNLSNSEHFGQQIYISYRDIHVEFHRTTECQYGDYAGQRILSEDVVHIWNSDEGENQIWCRRDDDICQTHDEGAWRLKNECTISDVSGGWIYDDDLITCANSEDRGSRYCFSGSYHHVEINGDWYDKRKPGIFLCANDDEWYLDEDKHTLSNGMTVWKYYMEDMTDAEMISHITGEELYDDSTEEDEGEESVEASFDYDEEDDRPF